MNELEIAYYCIRGRMQNEDGGDQRMPVPATIQTTAQMDDDEFFIMAVGGSWSEIPTNSI